MILGGFANTYDEDVKAQAPLRYAIEHKGFGYERRGCADCSAFDAELRNNYYTENEIDSEGSRVNQSALLPLDHHVAQSFGWPDRRAREQSDGENEHDTVALFEADTEQGKQGLPKRQNDHAGDHRRPECPANGFSKEHVQPMAVTGNMIFRKFVGRSTRYCEVHERDDRKQAGSGVVNRDVVRRTELFERDNVDIREEQV